MTNKEKQFKLTGEEDEVLTDLSENETSPGSGFTRPGALRGESTLILETLKAQKVFTGRRASDSKPMIVGLNLFASLLRIIWRAVDDEDPYAEFWLIKIERQLEEKEKQFDDVIAEYTKILGKNENLSHEIAHSIKPIKKKLKFVIPYSFKAAALLTKLDELVRTIMTAHHVGLVESKKAYDDIERSASAARRVFESARGYRFCDITRDDIIANNPKAQKAMESMGACPQAVMDDEIAPKFISSKAMWKRNQRLKLAQQTEKNQSNEKAT